MKIDLLWKFILLFCLKMNSSMFQDHIIMWDIKNEIFSLNSTTFNVKEGDNIVFICPTDTLRNQKLFWTTNKETYEDCGESSNSQIVKLFDCNHDPKSMEFILKVAQFSEIPYSPHFRENYYVYFLGQRDLCSIYNLRIAVKLVPNSHVSRESKITTSKTKEFTSSDQQLVSEATTNPYKLDISRNQPLSAWARYRFLLIPGSLGFLTLIGIQAVICALWHPKRPCQCQNCCTLNVANKPNNDTEDTTEISTTPIRLLENSYVERFTDNHKRHSLETTIRTIQPSPNCQFKNDRYGSTHKKRLSEITDFVQEEYKIERDNPDKSPPTIQLITNGDLPILTINSSQTTVPNNSYINNNDNNNVQFYTCPYPIDGNFTCLVPVKVNKPPDIFPAELVSLGSVINISV